MTALARIAGITCCCLAALLPAADRAEEAAVARLSRALAAAEAEAGKTSPDLLPVIARLAEAQRRDGALGEAAALRRRALDIAIAAFGCDSPRAAEAMTALAMLDIDRRRYLDAEPLLIIAEGVLKQRGAAKPAVRATIYAGLAHIALARGNKKSAEGWANRAVAVARSAAALRALGAVLTAEERFAAAERVLALALARHRTRHGADANGAARSLSQLAHLHLRRGQPREALPLIEEAMAIDQARLGPTHPFIADDLHDLGLVYEALHRDRMARRAFIAALHVLDRGTGRNTPRVAYAEIELSRLYRRAGDAAAADAAFKDARRILDKAADEEHERERKV